MLFKAAIVFVVDTSDFLYSLITLLGSLVFCEKYEIPSRGVDPSPCFCIGVENELTASVTSCLSDLIRSKRDFAQFLAPK